MKYTTIAATTAIALAMSIGTASAADNFSVLKNVSAATPLTAQQLDGVRGEGRRTARRVASNRRNAFRNSGGRSQALRNGSFRTIFRNPSP